MMGCERGSAWLAREESCGCLLCRAREQFGEAWQLLHSLPLCLCSKKRLAWLAPLHDALLRRWLRSLHVCFLESSVVEVQTCSRVLTHAVVGLQTCSFAQHRDSVFAPFEKALVRFMNRILFLPIHDPCG